MTTRDWKWIVSILAGIIIFLFSYKFWGKPGNLTEIISIGSGLASISLAVTAIIIAVAEGVKTSNKEKKVEGALDSIIANLRTMKELINKVDTDNFKTHDKLAKLQDKVEDYIKFYTEPEEKELEGKGPEEKEPEEKEPEEKEYPKGIIKVNIKRGDVFFADLSPTAGSELGGVRPVVIIQNEIGNRFSPTVTVAAITAQIQKARLPTHVVIDANRYEFDRDSVILLEQIRTIDKTRLHDKITHLDDKIMKKVDDALLIQLGLIEF